jgi:nitroreductase
MAEDKLTPEVQATRKPTYPIHPLILNRWSPRSMIGEEMSEGELMPLFEAARWAPSSYNGQPWRFLYAKRNTPSWKLFFDLMGESNQKWTKNAAALVVVISRKTFEHNNKPSITHSFDAGAAWMALALEAASRGFVAHGMEGFDYEKARKDLEIPEEFEVMAMIALGKRASKEKLPAELQAREQPSSRKSLKEICLEGKFYTPI